ncbi:MAG TPA: hypothetical protein VIZ28_18465 [Chitinophagaceae bacterium]
MRKYILLPAFALISLLAAAQVYLPFKQVQSYTQLQKASKFDSLQKYLTNRLGFELHYLYPLYQAIGWEEKFKTLLGEKRYYDNFSQLLSFTGDYAMASEYITKGFDPLSDTTVKTIASEISQLKNIQYAPAKEAITSNAGYYQVIMINETPAKPVHRAFTYSLLQDLYKAGYRYLAMETLNNYANRCLDSLNVFTGYYTNEPIGGELVRKALQLGYKLLSYEDTATQNHSSSQRDSVQARNICSILKKDPSAKILVHAGYANICEDTIGDYTPMAWWFKKISGIDPFTVEQTTLTQGSNFEYGRLYYNFFTDKFSITEPSVIFQNKRPFNPMHQKGYDLVMIHPPTVFTNNRPSWISLNGERQPVLIQPTERTLFLVQAYYENEYYEEILNVLIPADQTYIPTKEGYYCLNLRKGKYKIVMRDVGYQVLSVKDREVN